MKTHNAKIYGKTNSRKKFVELTELGFLATEEDLRAIAAFLLSAADGLAGSSSFGHMHFRDFAKKWKPPAADIVVSQSSPEKKKPNQSSQRNAMAQPVSVFESRSSRG